MDWFHIPDGSGPWYPSGNMSSKVLSSTQTAGSSAVKNASKTTIYGIQIGSASAVGQIEFRTVAGDTLVRKLQAPVTNATNNPANENVCAFTILGPWYAVMAAADTYDIFVQYGAANRWTP